MVPNEKIAGMGKLPEKNLWNHLTDHPKIAGALAMIALAVTFSPRLSLSACCFCLFGAYILFMAAVDGYPALRKSRHRSWLILVIAVVSASALFQLGIWLNRPKAEDQRGSQFRIGKMNFRAQTAEKHMAVDISFNNTGPSDINVKAIASLDVVDEGKNMSIDGSQYRVVDADPGPDLENKLWNSFIADNHKALDDTSGYFRTPPYQDTWISHSGPVVSAEEVEHLKNTSGKVLVFVLATFQWNVVGSNEKGGYDLCGYTTGNGVLFLCSSHNGAIKQP